MKINEEKEKIEWLFFAAVFVAVFATDFILKSIFHFGHRDRGILTSCVLLGGCFVYRIYFWRANLKGFLKRALIAVPFALLFGVFLIILNQNLISGVFALGVYLFLLFKTENWKQHFLIILTLASILAIVLKFSSNIIAVDIRSHYGHMVGMGGIVLITSLYSLYERKAENGEKVELCPIFIRVLKFTCTLCLYYAIWLYLHDYFRNHGIGSLIRQAVYGLITISYLGLIYYFDLMPIERKNKARRKEFDKQ